MNLLDIGNNVRNFLRKKALDVGFKPLKDNSLGANLRGIGQAGQISTNFAQKQVNNFAQPAYNIPIAGGVLKGIVNQPFNYASSGAQFLQNPNIKTGSSFLGQGLNTASMFVAPTGLSFKAGQRVMPQIPSMAKNSFLKIGLPSGAGGALDTYGKGGNAKDILSSFAFNTAVGSGAGIGFPLAGRGIKNTFNGLRPSPKPVLMPRNNPFIANLGIKDRPLEVNPNLPRRNYGTKPTPKKLMEGRDINLLDELFDKNIRKEIGRNSTTNQLAQLMDRYFTKAEIDKLPKNDNAWRKALAKRANQTEDYFDNKAKNTNQSFLKISNPKSDPLSQEATKYKSADEFIKAQGEPLYHGSRENITDFDLNHLNATYMHDGLGVNFTDNQDFAKLYARGKNEWGEIKSVDDGKGFVNERFAIGAKPLDLTAGDKKVSDVLTLSDFKKLANAGRDKEFARKNLERLARNSFNLDSRQGAQKAASMSNDELLKIAYDHLADKPLKSGEGLPDLFRQLVDVYGITDSDKSDVVKQFSQLLDVDYIKSAKKDGSVVYTVLNPSVLKTKSQLTDIWNRANKPDKYLYHGTNETVLESISNEGLKPGMRGQLSLSKDEAYARNFARDGMTPQGKTNAVMFRVKEGLLKGKTITSDNPNRPMSDQLHEVLTKEAIPPESLEVMRNGKWQPLIDILNKANKPKTEQSFLKIENPIQTPKMSVVNAEATPKTLDKIKIKDQKAQAKQAEIEFKEWQKQMFAREGATRTTTGAVRDASKLIGGNTRSMAAKDIAGLKDISSPATQFVDVFRNFKKVYGSKYEEVKKVVLDPLFVKGKTGMLDDQQMWIKKIDDFEKGFGIKKGSKQSADVQKYGEGLINEAGIVSKYGKKGAETIVEADKWFRKNYDQLLDEVNAVRAKIYPNNPDKIIPKRKDYYRHFNELSQGIDGLLNTLGRAIDVSPQLAGISYKTQPKSKWLSFAQKRIGSKTEYDAVGGFIDYVKAQTYAKHIDPHIDTFRQLGRELGETGVEEGKGLNNFGLFLEQFADNLSGKTNPADRFVQQLGGRKPMAVLNWVNQRVKANVILGNASSSIAQIFNLPNGIAEAGPKFATKGFGRAIASMFSPNKPQNQSVFLRERYFKGFEKFDRGMIDNGRRFAAWMITALDEVGTKSMWNMMYEKGSAQGLKGQALVNYADDVTRRMVAGRGIGEMALIQKSKAFQLVAPFQVEVTNAWYVIGDMIGEKAFGKLMTLALTTYVMNRAAEQIRGSDVSFDPIQATVEAIQAFNEEENKGVGAMRFAGRLGGEVISNVPFGQSAAAVYPEYGFMAGNTQYPTREQFFGKGDPTRFGSGLLATKGLQDPLFKILPPFGGQQIKRTIDGIDTTLKGYSQTPSGDVRFPAENSPVRSIQRAIFGEYSTPEAREYFDKNRSKLGSNQSEVFKNLSGADRENYYQGVLTKREKDKGVDELKTKEIEQSDIQNGPVINETLDRLVKSEYYQKLDEEGKYKAIDKAVANIRNQTKKTTNTETAKAPTAGQYEILNPETNKVKTIDIETPIEKPVLTGNTALDKKLISKFNSKLTSRGNDIVALYEDGQIDGKTAEAELAKLTTLRSSTAKAKKGKKPKKITIKKIAGAKKITNIKIAKSASLKPIKIKKLKLKSAKKVKKVGNIKIANYKLPKIKIS